METLTEEYYFFDTMEEAVAAIEKMKVERPCELAFDVSPMSNGHVKMTVKVGEPF